MDNRLTNKDELFAKHLRRGDQKLFAKKYDEAIDDYNKAIALKPNYARIKDYTKLIELKPDNADAYCDRGIAYSRNGEFDAMGILTVSKVSLNPPSKTILN